MLSNADIQIRDPFIVPVPEEGRYYLYGTTDLNCWGGEGLGFNAFWGNDLVLWHGPFTVFKPPADFWGTMNFWAPEVHRYQGKYYMFASFKSPTACRGTQVLVSTSPLGPFTPHSRGPLTPANWECLDGTLFVDDDGNPWMVFCHEWVQIHNGEMCVVRLSPDLSQPISEPVTLFKAADAPWVHPIPSGSGDDLWQGYVTDGPYLYRAKNGHLLMLWSSFGSEGYAMGIARCATHSLLGPWEHDILPLFSKDGGHGMLFEDFNKKLVVTLHTPNDTPNERPVFLQLREVSGHLAHATG